MSIFELLGYLGLLVLFAIPILLFLAYRKGSEAATIGVRRTKNLISPALLPLYEFRTAGDFVRISNKAGDRFVQLARLEDHGGELFFGVPDVSSNRCYLELCQFLEQETVEHFHEEKAEQTNTYQMAFFRCPNELFNGSRLVRRIVDEVLKIDGDIYVKSHISEYLKDIGLKTRR